MRWDTVAARLAVGFASLAFLGGCAAGATPSPSATPTLALVTPAPSASPSPIVTPGASSSASTSPSPTPPAAAASTSPAPKPTGSLVGHVVTTLADQGLRVRSAPSVSNDSYRYEPLLPMGTPLYVLDGPKTASGYAWYEVAPLASRTPPVGWVASAGRDGTPWIAPGIFTCPPMPTDLRSLAALPPGVGLACFPRVPITVTARLIWCRCDVDGSWYSPGWFYLGSGSPNLLVEPGVTSVPAWADWFVLNLDPAGQYPDPLPMGEVVEVTGIFDHPAAASCTRTDFGGERGPSQRCRLEFAVTRLVVQEA
jgi:hypothetical protein